MRKMSRTKKVILVVAALLLLGFVWFRGTFDTVLVNVGLNAQPCVQLYYGRTLCGENAKEFCRNLYDYTNAAACDEVLGTKQR